MTRKCTQWQVVKVVAAIGIRTFHLHYNCRYLRSEMFSNWAQKKHMKYLFINCVNFLISSLTMTYDNLEPGVPLTCCCCFCCCSGDFLSLSLFVNNLLYIFLITRSARGGKRRHKLSNYHELVTNIKTTTTTTTTSTSNNIYHHMRSAETFSIRNSSEICVRILSKNVQFG